MSEQWPNSEVFHPTEAYYSTVSRLLDDIFAVPVTRQEERLKVPDSVQHRAWVQPKNGYFWATRLVPEAAAALPGTDVGQQVTLLHFRETDTIGVYELRSYLFYRDSGDMLVLDRLITTDEVAATRFEASVGDQFRRAIEKGFSQRLRPAKDIHYLDFLADLDTFEGSIEA
jgi:hypothetical protein